LAEAYQPFDFSDRFNILEISEAHCWEEPDSIGQDVSQRHRYRENVGDQLKRLSEIYNVDETWILGDTGSLDDVHGILEPLGSEDKVKMIAGDEDKVKTEEVNKPWIGFYNQLKNGENLELEAEIEIEDEFFQREIDGYLIQASHHPNNHNEFIEGTKSGEITEEPVSVEKDLNKEMKKRNNISLDSLQDLDVIFYDHCHMRYPREIENTAVMGLGGRRVNYHRGADEIPESSIHLTSIGDEGIHQMEFDADTEEIYEHVLFTEENGEMKMYDCANITDEPKSYKPIQTRFHPDQIREEAVSETKNQLPPILSSLEEI
jgi:predicted phosphodiesterase